MKGYHSHKVFEGSIWTGRFDMVCDSAEYVSLDRTGEFMALTAKNCDRIELWDVRSYPIPMNSVRFPETMTSGTNEPKKIWWSFDSTCLCALVDMWISDERKLAGAPLARKKGMQRLLAWNVIEGRLVGDWIFKSRVATASFIPGCQNSLIYITYQGIQGHAIVNINAGIMWELDVVPLRDGFLNAGETLWPKEKLVKSESKLIAWSTEYDADPEILDSDTKFDSNYSSSVVVAVSALGDFGGEMITVLNDSKGNAVCILRIEIQCTWDEHKNQFSLSSAEITASTSQMPQGAVGPILSVDTSRALSQARVLVGWAHSTVAIYEFSNSMIMKWSTCANQLHSVKPPRILSLGYVARYLEKRHQHLLEDNNGKGLNQNQQALDAFVIVIESENFPAGLLVHNWCGKMIFCHEADGIAMDTRLKWTTFDSSKLGLSEVSISPHPSRMSIWGIGNFSQKKRLNSKSKRQKARVLQCYTQRLESDFPGPMYPIGFSLREECNEYVEAEDELDGVVRNRKDGKPTADDEFPILCQPVQSQVDGTLPATTNQAKGVFDRGRYNELQLLDQSCSLDIGDSFGNLTNSDLSLRIPLCILQMRGEAGQGKAAANTALGEKTASGLWLPYPREAAVMAYSQKIIEDDEENEILGAGNAPVGLIGSVFGPDIGIGGNDGGEDDEDDLSATDEAGSPKQRLPPLHFSAFLRPPENILSGKYRAKTLAPQVVQAMQMAQAFKSNELRAEKRALLAKEAVDDLRRDMIRRHKSLQSKLDRERLRQINDVRNRLTNNHYRDMEDTKRIHDVKMREREKQRAQASASVTTAGGTDADKSRSSSDEATPPETESGAELGKMPAESTSLENPSEVSAQGAQETVGAVKRSATSIDESLEGQPKTKSLKV